MEITNLSSDKPDFGGEIKMNKVKVLLVDDHERFRQSVAAYLNEQGTVEIVGEAVNGDEAIAKTEQLRPDLVLMDVDMPNRDGFEATREIKLQRPETKVVILSMHGSDIYRRTAWRYAADGFIDKSSMKEALLALIMDGKAPGSGVALNAT
jgi:two-component system, NarL family, response regulator NreC